MLKIVLDTNLFLSAFLYGGMSQIITDLILDKKLVMFVSEALKTEVLKKLKEYGANEQILFDVSLFLDSRGIAVIPKAKVTICRDPKDNYLLELVEEVQADYLVTRDKDLLELPENKWKSTKIIKPEDFLPFLRSIELIL